MAKTLPKALDVDSLGGLTEKQTAHTGVALLIDTARRSGVMATAEQHLHTRKSTKGLGQVSRGEDRWWKPSCCSVR